MEATVDTAREAQAIEQPRLSDAHMMAFLMRVFSRRALNGVAGLLVFALACWAMWQPSSMRVVIAAGFAGFCVISQVLLAWSER